MVSPREGARTPRAHMLTVYGMLSRNKGASGLMLVGWLHKGKTYCKGPLFGNRIFSGFVLDVALQGCTAVADSICIGLFSVSCK